MMRWYNKQTDTGSKWYYDDNPCELLSLGVKIGDKTPSVMRLKLFNDLVLNVMVDRDGNFPHVTYTATEPLILVGP
jgi:hypothetical protein